MHETLKERHERHNEELRGVARKLKMRVDRLNEEIELGAPDIMIKNELGLIGDALKELTEVQSVVEEEKAENMSEDFTKALAGAMLLHALLQLTDL